MGVKAMLDYLQKGRHVIWDLFMKWITHDWVIVRIWLWWAMPYGGEPILDKNVWSRIVPYRTAYPTKDSFLLVKPIALFFGEIYPNFYAINNHPCSLDHPCSSEFRVFNHMMWLGLKIQNRSSRAPLIVFCLFGSLVPWCKIHKYIMEQFDI